MYATKRKILLIKSLNFLSHYGKLKERGHPMPSQIDSSEILLLWLILNKRLKWDYFGQNDKNCKTVHNRNAHLDIQIQIFFN